MPGRRRTDRRLLVLALAAALLVSACGAPTPTPTAAEESPSPTFDRGPRPPCQIDESHGDRAAIPRTISYPTTPRIGLAISLDEIWRREMTTEPGSTPGLLPHIYGATCDTLLVKAWAPDDRELLREGALAGISLTTGEVLWSRKMPDRPFVMIEAANRLVVEGGYRDTWEMLDADSGTELFTADHVVAFNRRTAEVLRREAGELELLDRDGTSIWTSEVGEATVYEVALSSEAVALHMGDREGYHFLVLDGRTGEERFRESDTWAPTSYPQLAPGLVVTQKNLEPDWDKKLEFVLGDITLRSLDGEPRGSLATDLDKWRVVGDSHLVFLREGDSEDGYPTLAAVRIDAPEEILWERPVSKDVRSIHWAEGLVILRHDTWAHTALDLETGETAWPREVRELIAHDGEGSFYRQYAAPLQSRTLDGGEERWRLDLSDGDATRPIWFEVAGDHLLAYTYGELFVLVP